MKLKKGPMSKFDGEVYDKELFKLGEQFKEGLKAQGMKFFANERKRLLLKSNRIKASKSKTAYARMSAIGMHLYRLDVWEEEMKKRKK